MLRIIPHTGGGAYRVRLMKCSAVVAAAAAKQRRKKREVTQCAGIQVASTQSEGTADSICSRASAVSSSCAVRLVIAELRTDLQRSLAAAQRQQQQGQQGGAGSGAVDAGKGTVLLEVRSLLSIEGVLSAILPAQWLIATENDKRTTTRAMSLSLPHSVPRLSVSLSLTLFVYCGSVRTCLTVCESADGARVLPAAREVRVLQVRSPLHNNRAHCMPN
eukprot:COSAG05_NODE_188_length_14697_cov_11.861145_17_plen_218_part_00